MQQGIRAHLQTWFKSRHHTSFDSGISGSEVSNPRARSGDSGRGKSVDLPSKVDLHLDRRVKLIIGEGKDDNRYAFDPHEI